MLDVSTTNMKEELESNLKVILRSADLVYDSKDYTSATILYFKALFCILDIALLKKTGQAPTSHKERFRSLEKEMPAEYTLIDKYFPIYQQTYTSQTSREDCNEIRKLVKDLEKRAI